MAGNNDKRVIECSNPSCQKKWTPGQPNFKSCSQCGQAKYCSKECQKAHWKQHKRACKKKAQQIQQQQDQSQQSIKSPQLSQKQNVMSPKLNQNNNKKQKQQQQQQQSPTSPQLKQSKGKQSPQLHHQSQKDRSPSPPNRSFSSEKEVKYDSNDQKKLASELSALKKERKEFILAKQEALFFLEQTKNTINQQNEKMESFTERLRLTLSKVEKIHENIESIKAIC